ncbi:MAG: hypothetical protein M3361_14570 [Candidatus Tectomicrobia bacterium]|nr:hypothetical protein [Candidatus Tectomicrobia bacterium]
MAKLAQKGERTFSPIADKLIEAVSAPEVPPSGPAEESPPERKVVPMRREEEGNTHQEPPHEAPLAEPSFGKRLSLVMRYHVSDEEKQETERFVHRISQAAEVSITHSNLMRACRDLLFQVEDRLTLELSRAKLKRPINDKQAIAFFESRLTEIIHTAIRQSPLPYARGGK